MSGIIYCPACKGIAGWSGTNNIISYIGDHCKCSSPASYNDLIKERDAYKKTTEILLGVAECANNQWGDNYLWKKFGLSTEMDRAKAMKKGPRG